MVYRVLQVDKQLVDLHRGQNATISVRQTVPVGCNYSVGIPDKVQRCAIALSTVDISEEYHEVQVVFFTLHAYTVVFLLKVLLASMVL